MRSLNENYFVGIDVGTGSARAGVFDGNGNLKGSVSAPIQMWKPARDFVEQSSDDIWRKCCEVVRAAVEKAGISPEAVKGIGFDATCSTTANTAFTTRCTTTSCATLSLCAVKRSARILEKQSRVRRRFR